MIGSGSSVVVGGPQHPCGAATPGQHCASDLALTSRDHGLRWICHPRVRSITRSVNRPSCVALPRDGDNFMSADAEKTQVLPAHEVTTVGRERT